MLSRRWLINCILIVAIGILAWAGFYFDNTPEQTRGPGVSTLQVEDVEAIEIHTGTTPISLQRRDDGWHIIAPIDWGADDDRVKRLLSILDQEVQALAQLADIDAPALGLQPPQAVLQLNDTRLAFGDTNNIGGRRYLLVDSTLYLLPDVHLALAMQGLPGIVDRRLLAGRDDLSELRLPELELKLGADGQWQSSGGAAAKMENLQQLASNWQNMPANRVNRFDPGTAQGEPVEARFKNGDRIEFVLLPSETEITIANPDVGLQYHFPADHYEKLLAPPAAE